MKKILFTILCLGFMQASFAQQDLKRANTYFERAYYTDAIPLYEELAKTNKSSVVIKNLADSYFNTNQLPNAAKWYSYLTSVYGKNLDESYFFKYSQTLKAVGEFEEATEVMMAYYAAQNQPEKVAELKAQLTHLENVDAIGERFDLENLALNTAKSEFGAVKVDSTLIYSAPKKKALVKKVYRWNNESYLDMYAHPISQLAIGDSISTSYSETINTKMHEATFAISKDRKTIYFTRNNFSKGKKKTDGNKVSRLKIYKAEWVDNKWQNEAELPFNNDDYSTEHPTLNPSENILYFSSDRPGGFGSLDLYSVAINENGTYGDPINLGETINTERREQFPFVDESNQLYFSSNGHAGFGLLDVFVSQQKNGTFQKPNNVGKPINSGYDDFAYAVNHGEKKGFFSSNRPDGKGSDDIYQFTETKELIIEDCKQFIAGIITDATTKLPIAFAEVVLVDNEGNIIETQTASQDAEFKFTASCEAEYKVQGRKIAYEENSKVVITNKDRSSIKDGSLELMSHSEVQKQKSETLQKEKEEETRKAQLAEEERIKEEENARKAAERAKEKAEKERLERVERAIEKEPAIERQGERIVIKAEPKIHFDYDLWYIRLKSKETLDEILRILKENPGIILEIGTHTDIRGNNKYNMDLSQKRSNSVVEYLVESGIDKSRLTGKGYGETKTLVKCATEEACSEQQHEINRRCEFVIIKWE